MSRETPGIELWKPDADSKALDARAAMMGRVRGFFAQRNVREVETPVLSHAANSDPAIGQFETREPHMWLRTSPEYAMKRLLAAGSGDIFELARVFRRGESGRYHNQEFTMLEWYRQAWTYLQLMDEVVALIRHCLPDKLLQETRLSYREAFSRYTGLDPYTSTIDDFSAFIRAKQLQVPDLSRAEILDLVISHFIQTEFPENALTVVFDYPADQAALARIRQDDPPVAERFEVFLGKTELANGYQELTNATEQRSRFDHENRLRQKNGMSTGPVDERLISALQEGLPECSGVALGFDRLLMVSLSAGSLADVLAFTDRLA